MIYTHRRQEIKQGSILHVLRDDHDGVGLGHDALQEDDVGVLELPHDARLCEEVDLGLVGEKLIILYL